MRVLTILVISLFAILGCSPKIKDKIVTQQEIPKIGKIAPALTDTLPFPESWLGTWTGNLDIWKGPSIVKSIPMKTIIAATNNVDEYQWMTTFGDKAQTEKPYLLKVIDREKGLYIIDEQNSIVLESYLFDQKLVSWYTVMGSLIQSTFEKKGKTLIFEILAGKEEPISVTGGAKVGEEDVPEVKTMPFSVMQRAFLTRE